MKTLAPAVQVIEVANEGFDALLGQVITLFCANYIYTGTLVGNNTDFDDDGNGDDDDGDDANHDDDNGNGNDNDNDNESD